MKVVIITEGSKEIGLGHVTRCMSLYQAFNKKNIPVQFIVNGNSVIESLLKDTEYKIINWLEYPDNLFKLLEKSDIVIIDSYLAHEDFYNKIYKFVELAVYIDDNKRIDYPEGIVINGSILATELNYTSKKGVKHLLGSRYVPLRREFWNVPKKEIKDTIKRIMITFGGDDLRDMTPTVLKLLIDKYPNVFKNVVIGKGFKNIAEIEDLKDDKVKLLYYPDASEMLKSMMESDIAISAGGQTLYELARIGIPTIAISVALNQLNNVKNWQKCGFIQYIGFWNDKDLFNNIIKSINSLRDINTRFDMSENGRKFVDGLGAIRIVKYSLKKYYLNQRINLRPAKLDDMYNIYELSNDTLVRLNSFNTSKIKLKEHNKWFCDNLNDDNSLIFVAEVKNEFIGQIRFYIHENEVVISISIVEKYRKLGLGKYILLKSIKYLKSNVKSIKKVKAQIKEDNTISIDFFKGCDFEFEKNIILKGNKAVEYVYTINEE